MKMTLQQLAQEIIVNLNQKGEKNQEKSEYLVREFIKAQPDNLDSTYFYAALMRQKGLIPIAISLFERILSEEAFSQDPHIWNLLGCCYRDRHDLEPSRTAFRNAIKYSNKQEDIDVFEGNLYATYVADGQAAYVLEHLGKVIERNPTDTTSLYNKGLAELELGNWTEGWKGYEHRKTLNDQKVNENDGLRGERHKHPVTGNPFPLWTGEPDSVVIVSGEQGLGDEILFASIIPELCTKVRKVIFECHPRLMPIFRYSFSHINNLLIYGTRKDHALFWPSRHYQEVTHQVMLGSLPFYFRNKDTDFNPTPFLTARPDLVKLYKQKLAAISNRPKIGISWKGGVIRNNARHRRMDFNYWDPIFRMPFDFINLQYNDDAGLEIQKLWDEEHIRIYNFKTGVANYEHTAALVMALDCVISVPQSVVHLAGALGQICFQLCPVQGMWQQGVYGHDLLWYSSVKNIWQDLETKDWKTVVDKLVEILTRAFKIAEAVQGGE